MIKRLDCNPHYPEDHFTNIQVAKINEIIENFNLLVKIFDYTHLKSFSELKEADAKDKLNAKT